MSHPRVSICLPNLNTRRYLQERIDTIVQQTYPDWELVVSDNYSDDGAWEFFEELAQKDPRVNVAQAPRQGLYANWNRCIERAGGEFVYIATSDDTMAPDCLEKMVAALDANPRCDIAHCMLRPIDEHGHESQAMAHWWAHAAPFAQTSGPLVHVPHLRLAPFDGLQHLMGRSVYISITQLLIRRSLFERIGLFEPAWGSIGDFNWNMRAGLAANTVHVPGTWGGWRLHATQATAGAGIGSDTHARHVSAMIDHAIETCAHLLAPALRRRLTGHWRGEAEQMRAYFRELRRRPGRIARKAFVVRRALTGSTPARTHIKTSLSGRSLEDWVTMKLDEAGFGNMLQSITPMASAMDAAPAGSKAPQLVSIGTASHIR